MKKIKAYILLIWFILSIPIGILISLKYKDFEVLAIINIAFPLIFIISDEEICYMNLGRQRMKLEVGQFIRFKDKRGIEYIRKITSVNTTYPDRLYAGIYIDKEANNSNGVSLKNIVNTDFEAINLLKAGDVITFKDDEDVYRILQVPDNEDMFEDFYLAKEYGGSTEDIFVTYDEMKEYIDTIVTKEQFEQMTYKVGE